MPQIHALDIIGELQNLKCQLLITEWRGVPEEKAMNPGNRLFSTVWKFMVLGK